MANQTSTTNSTSEQVRFDQAANRITQEKLPTPEDIKELRDSIGELSLDDKRWLIEKLNQSETVEMDNRRPESGRSETEYNWGGDAASARQKNLAEDKNHVDAHQKTMAGLKAKWGDDLSLLKSRRQEHAVRVEEVPADQPLVAEVKPSEKDVIDVDRVEEPSGVVKVAAPPTSVAVEIVKPEPVIENPRMAENPAMSVSVVSPTFAPPDKELSEEPVQTPPVKTIQPEPAPAQPAEITQPEIPAGSPLDAWFGAFGKGELKSSDAAGLGRKTTEQEKTS